LPSLKKRKVASSLAALNETRLAVVVPVTESSVGHSSPTTRSTSVEEVLNPLSPAPSSVATRKRTFEAMGVSDEDLFDYDEEEEEEEDDDDEAYMETSSIEDGVCPVRPC
jgi:hypothetical protein